MPFTISDADALLAARVVADRRAIPDEVTAVAGIVIPAAKAIIQTHAPDGPAAVAHAALARLVAYLWDSPIKRSRAGARKSWSPENLKRIGGRCAIAPISGDSTTTLRQRERGKPFVRRSNLPWPSRGIRLPMPSPPNEMSQCIGLRGQMLNQSLPRLISSN